MFNSYEFKAKFIKIKANDIINLMDSEVEIKRKPLFFEKLEKSILEEGIRNPIMVTSGFCPQFKRYKLKPFLKEQKLEDMIICARYGGSRLYIAQKHDLVIPCIVADFVDMFKGKGRNLNTKEDVENLYTPKLRSVVVNEEGFWGVA